MSKPKVSVFTPSYNKPNLVKEAIESVLNQTYKNFEYIIIENSTDNKTREIVKGYKDKRIRYFEEDLSESARKRHYVPALLINKYYDLVTGDYIIFLADDDLLLPNCLELMVDFLKKRGVSVAYHGQLIQYISGDGKVTFDSMIRDPQIVLKKGVTNPKELLDGGQVMFAASLLKKVGQPYLPTSNKVAEICDRIFLEKLWRLSSFYPVNKVLSVKRVTPLSTHPLRRGLKYKIYPLLTSYLPEPIRIFFGEATKKRHRIAEKERLELEKFARQRVH